MTKAVTISARIPQEDATFISQLEISDAKTPSDKLRAIIAEARLHYENRKDLRGSITMMQELIAPASTAVREFEIEQDMHSELISRFLEWLPDAMAFTLTAATANEDRSMQQQLASLENGIADRVFRLVESILQMGVTQRCSCYDKQAIHRRVEPILDLAHVISMMRQPVEEKKK
ncbi:MAG: hypothetical protein PVG66_15335 [Chromatiales bacterium]